MGRCSLTVALPILSAAGLEASALPTAVLSTHTGGFTGMTFRDLTQDLPAIFAHWKTLDLAFDAIYTGYLGSAEQVALVAVSYTHLIIVVFGAFKAQGAQPGIGKDLLYDVGATQNMRNGDGHKLSLIHISARIS